MMKMSKIRKFIFKILISFLIILALHNSVSALPVEQQLKGFTKQLTCSELSAFDSIPADDIQTILVPVLSHNRHGTSVLLAEHDYPEYKVQILERDEQGNFKGSNELPKYRKIPIEQGKTILDFTGTGHIGKEKRIILVILVPKHLKMNFNIVAVGLKKRDSRNPLYYHSVLRRGGLQSVFNELSTHIPKGIEVSPEMNTLLLENTASGDILIPSVYKKNVNIENMKIISDYPSCN